MIQVNVFRDATRSITEIVVAGHADFAAKGEDLVCAAVSAITFGSANAIEYLLGVETVVGMNESGFLHFRVPHIEEANAREQVQLLMEAMLVSLNTVVNSYTDEVKTFSDYIQINDKS